MLFCLWLTCVMHLQYAGITFHFIIYFTNFYVRSKMNCKKMKKFDKKDKSTLWICRLVYKINFKSLINWIILLVLLRTKTVMNIISLDCLYLLNKIAFIEKSEMNSHCCTWDILWCINNCKIFDFYHILLVCISNFVMMSIGERPIDFYLWLTIICVYFKLSVLNIEKYYPYIYIV